MGIVELLKILLRDKDLPETVVWIEYWMKISCQKGGGNREQGWRVDFARLLVGRDVQCLA